MQQKDISGILRVHTKHRNSMRTMLRVLLVLATVQLAAWLLPAWPEFSGIPHYLPLHVFLENISIIVSMMVFAVGWNSHNRNLSGNVVLLACIYFSVALLDFAHTVSYGGMPDFISPNDAQKHLNFWLSARLFAAVALLVVALSPWQRTIARITRYLTLAAWLGVTLFIIWAVIYHQSWLPDTFIQGSGLTAFKKNVEYAIILINIATAALFWRAMKTPQIFKIELLFTAACTLAMSEFFFTLYTTMTGSYNVLGHIYKVIAYLLIYRAIVVEVIEEPYKLLEQAKDKLKTSKDQLDEAQSLVKIGNWRVIFGKDEAEDQWFVSRELQKIWGNSNPDEITTATGFAAMPPEDGELTRRFWAAAKRREGPAEWEHRIIVGGQIRWVHVIANFIFDDHGVALEASGTNQDITERKLAELALKAESEKNLAFLRNASDGIHILDSAGNLIEASDSFCSMLGYTREELTGLHVSQWDAQFTHTEINLALQQQLSTNGRSQFETRHRRKDGTILDVEISGAALELDGVPALFNSSRDITARKAAESKLRTLLTAVEQSPVSVVIADVDANITYVNPRFTAITGYSAQEAIGHNPRILQSGLTPKEVYLQMWDQVVNGRIWNGELINKRKNGEIYWEDAYIAPVRNDAGTITHYVATKIDMSERKRNHEALRKSEERFKFILGNSPIAVRIADLATSAVVFANRQYTELIGSTDTQVLGINPRDYYAVPQEYDEVVQQIRNGDRVTNKLVELHIHGEKLKTKWVLASYLKLDYENEPAILGWFYDISDRKEMEDKVQHLAHYDMLTNMPNRMLFSDRLQQTLATAKRDRTRLALMFIDLDRFKQINDEFGHQVGDVLLQEAAARMQTCVRASDTLARMGGDEFVVLLPAIETAQDALPVAEKIRTALNLPFELAGNRLNISSSIGIVLYPEHGENATELLKNADVAMYSAKESGRNAVVLYRKNGVTPQ